MALEANNVRDYSWIAGGIAVAGLAGYVMWLNRPGSDFSWASRGPGGVYIGLGGGANFVAPSDWKIQMSGTTTHKSIAPTSSVLFNAKLGYFFHRFPYLGLEGEFNYTKNKVRQTYFDDIFDNASFVLRIMGRYGFLPDSEVPFGRLQPYVGIGPGLELVMAKNDTAKNIGLEVSAGLRYMFFKNFSTFAEYRFSYQVAVEINPRLFNISDVNGPVKGNYMFDYTRHMAVVGLAYHFL